MLTVSETGYGRLSKLSDYRIQSRGGYGLTNYHTDKYGKVAAIKAVDLDDDIIIISDNGVIIRIEASSIRICARPSKGVIVMKTMDNSRVATIARAPRDDADDSVENEEPEEEEFNDPPGNLEDEIVDIAGEGEEE